MKKVSVRHGGDQGPQRSLSLGQWRRCAVLVLAVGAIGVVAQPFETAVGGAWSGGGGELVGDRLNPWFLHPASGGGSNTPGAQQVGYCILAAPDFPQPADELKTVVQGALDHWHLEFSNSHVPLNQVFGNDNVLHKASVLVNTRGFRRMDSCADDQVELKFQFGHLESSQVDELTRLGTSFGSIIGLSVRTDYNPETMRGRGFIYITPDRGNETYRSRQIPEGSWEGQEGLMRLKNVVIHELGHVHGLQHALKDGSIMSMHFVQDLFSPDLFRRARAQVASNQREFFANVTQGVALPIEKLKVGRRFLGLPESVEDGDPSDGQLVDLLNVQFSLNGVDLYRGFDSSSVIARARFENGGQRRYESLVSLWLPKGQKVYASALDQRTLLGPARVEVQNQGVLEILATGERKPIFVQFSPTTFQMGGVVDGALVPDLLSLEDNMSSWLFPSASGWQE